jgi:membrane fusion protein, macrolide-specific efflux system
MVETGAIEAPENPVESESPVDLTQELPLDDENVLADEPPSVWRRYRWPIIGVVVVLIAAAVGLSLWLTAGASSPTGLTVTTATVRATTGTIQQTVASSGTLEPASQANVNFAVPGTVTAVNVKAGQTVTAGQVLATVGTTALTDDEDAAQAQLTAAQDRLSSDESSNASTSTIDSDEASVTSAESSLSTAQTNLNDASLTSTIAGTVASVDLTVGQQVSANGSGGSGGTGAAASGTSAAASSDTGSTASGTGSSSGEIVVVGTDSYIVNATVDDTEIGEIADGDQVDITPTGDSTPVYGTVGSISLIGSESSDVTSFPVVIDVTGNPPNLYAGATADVNIIVKQLNDVTEVPTGAISYGTNGQATVTKVVNGSHIVTDVTVGAAENGETQITSGVKPGDKVLERQITFKAPGGGIGGLLGRGGTTGRFGGGGTGGFGGFGGGGGFSGGGTFPAGGFSGAGG